MSPNFDFASLIYMQTPIDRKKQLTAIRNERQSPDSQESSSPLEDSFQCMCILFVREDFVLNSYYDARMYYCLFDALPFCDSFSVCLSAVNCCFLFVSSFPPFLSLFPIFPPPPPPPPLLPLRPYSPLSAVPPRYLSSQYLADSSLSTDVSKFDFSAGPQVSLYACPMYLFTFFMFIRR